MAVEDGVAIPVGTQALLAAGTDGTNAQILSVDSSGQLIAVGAGTAGTPVGGVISIQGVAGGTAVPISGSITATNPSVGSNGSAIPASSTQIGGSDGTNLQAASIFDADSGAGSQYVLGTILRKSASGGSVEAGTSSDPLRIDPTGTTTQPISASSLPLPTGAATEATLSTRLADSTFTGRINTLGQKTSANSTPVVIASDQSSIAVTATQGTAAALSGYWPVCVTDGTNTMPTGDAVGRAIFQKITDGTNTAAVKAASTAAVASDPALVVAISPNNTVTVSGTVTANIGTSGSLALDATLTGGTQKAIIRGGAKGSTTASDVTSTASGANHQAVDVIIYDTSGNAITSFGGGTQFADGAARGTATGTLMMVDDGTNIQSASGDSTGKLNVNAIQSTAAALSGAWPVKVTDGTNSMPTGDAVGRAIFHKVTDGTNTAAVKAASTAAVASDPALVVAISPNNLISVSGTADATGTGALGALNAAVQVTTAGLSSVGFQLAAGTLVGTIVPEVSFDGGTTWIATYLSDPTTGIKSSSVVFSVSNTATAREIVGVGGSGLTRIRVSAYTSGTANITLRASLQDGSSLARYTTGGSGYTTLTSPNALPLGMIGQVTSYGTLKVTTEGSELFVEPFDGVTVDTTNRWTQTIVGGATVSQASGTLTMATGTTANNAAALSSQNQFRAVGLGFQIFGASLGLEAAALTNNHRFWGLGTQPVSWAAATPIQDGAGFEQDTTGALNAVTYSSGTRTIAAVLTRPTDGLNHRYAMYIRADLVFWYVDTLEYPVASASWPPLGQQTLPIRFHSINHTSGPSSGPTFNILGVGMTETSHSGVQISDGTFAWRKATVKPASTAAVATDPALVVAISPNNTISVSQTASTSSVTSVSGSASSVQLLAANTTRKGGTLYNDSTAILYLKLGTTASTTSFTVRILSNGYYELPISYTGRIDGIWASATGAARITELT